MNKLTKMYPMFECLAPQFTKDYSMLEPGEV